MKILLNFTLISNIFNPFQDGNGRVGRLIALKECLRFNIIPFIIEDQKKSFYYRGLANWKDEKGWLIDTCFDGQDAFKRLLELLDINVEFQLLFKSAFFFLLKCHSFFLH